MQKKFMARAIEIAREAVDTDGTLPYAAIVVLDGEIIGEGLNRSVANCDPTSHGEVEAIRDACRRLSLTSLKGAELYTSGEPCSMCVRRCIRLAFHGYIMPVLQTTAPPSSSALPRTILSGLVVLATRNYANRLDYRSTNATWGLNRCNGKVFSTYTKRSSKAAHSESFGFHVNLQSDGKGRISRTGYWQIPARILLGSFG